MKSYVETDIDNAIKTINNGASIRKTSIKFGIPRTTLFNRLHGTQPRSTSSTDLQRLSPAQEASLTQWALTQAVLGPRPTHAQLKETAERVLARQGDSRPLGGRWIERFLGRNPVLRTRRSRKFVERSEDRVVGRQGAGSVRRERLGVDVELSLDMDPADTECTCMAGRQARRVDGVGGSGEAQSPVDVDDDCIVVASY